MPLLDYEFQGLLGTGAFSEVVLANSKVQSGLRVAVKCIDKNALKRTFKCKDDSLLKNEVRILKRLKHPNIIQLVSEFEEENHVYLVLDLVTGGELFERIVSQGIYSEKDAVIVIKQVLEALDYMHVNGVIHCDLKPENLLYYSPDEDSKIMITDFGLSKIENSNTDNVPCGTPGYIAPEVFMYRRYSKAVDVWSLGVISYILSSFSLCGYQPFDDENDSSVLTKVMRGQYEFDSPYWDDISSSAKDFISHMMFTNPAKRFSCLQALEHPWINGNVASTKNIYQTVSEQLKRTCAKRNWKKAYNTTAAMIKWRHRGSLTSSTTTVVNSNSSDSPTVENANVLPPTVAVENPQFANSCVETNAEILEQPPEVPQEMHNTENFQSSPEKTLVLHLSPENPDAEILQTSVEMQNTENLQSSPENTNAEILEQPPELRNAEILQTSPQMQNTEKLQSSSENPNQEILQKSPEMHDAEKLQSSPENPNEEILQTLPEMQNTENLQWSPENPNQEILQKLPEKHYAENLQSSPENINAEILQQPPEMSIVKNLQTSPEMHNTENFQSSPEKMLILQSPPENPEAEILQTSPEMQNTENLQSSPEITNAEILEQPPELRNAEILQTSPQMQNTEKLQSSSENPNQEILQKSPEMPDAEKLQSSPENPNEEILQTLPEMQNTENLQSSPEITNAEILKRRHTY